MEAASIAETRGVRLWTHVGRRVGDRSGSWNLRDVMTEVVLGLPTWRRGRGGMSRE